MSSERVNNIKVGQYAKLAAHEIRGSLNVIGNVLEEVAEDFADNLPDVARKALESAHIRCRKVIDVVERILSEPENAGNQSWVQTNDLLQEIRDRMPLYADGKNVNLKLPDESLCVWADPIALREVFANLISNAVQHLDKADGYIRIEQQSTAELHTFAVVDDGPGVPPGRQQQIFDPSYRTQTGHHNGKGLGLYFVRRIVEEHGGRVWVEPGEDGGSRFLFSLPTVGRQPNGFKPHAA
ncbi:MAG: hypothetical protein Fues2KO_17170 [Fuerstiella sp.]